jgi:hypothetical protein
MITRILLLLLLPILGFSQKYENYLREYTAEKGEHDFRPSTIKPRLYWLLGGRSTPTSCVRFDPNTWFSWKLPNGEVDSDVYDWNYKIFGVSPLLEQHNKNGVMFAARPTADSLMMELCLYQNKDFAFAYQSLKVFNVTEVYGLYLEFKKFNKNKLLPCVSAYNTTGQLLWYIEADEVDYKWAPSKEIWLWFGGKDDDGNFGGVTSQKTTIYGYKIK